MFGIGFFIRLLLLVGLALWLVHTPGEAQIVWRDMVIETTAAFLVFFILLAAGALVLLDRLWRLIMQGPLAWSLGRQIKHLKEGQKDIAQGFAAIAEGRTAEAGRHAARARKALGETSLTQFLMAQSAHMAGDSKTAKTLYQAMTRENETAALGYRGLIMEALKSGDDAQAAAHIDGLAKACPDAPWLFLARLEMAVRREAWDEALTALEKARKLRAIDTATAQRHEAALLLAQAQNLLKASEPKQAIEKAERARKLRPLWAPATLVLAEASIAAGHARTALRVIEKDWSRAPHPHMIPLFLWAHQDETPVGLLRKVVRLTSDNPEVPESLMARAEAALKADLWGEARRYLMMLLSKGEATQATYQMLARLETRETGNQKVAAAWTAKALTAPAAPEWQCSVCGAHAAHWQASCSTCHSFNVIEWHIPGQTRLLPETRRPLLLDGRG